MAPRGRVQVNDLSEPERLIAQPIKRDTFEQPAQAPINNDLERLSHALGYFNQNLQAYARADEADRKRAEAEAKKAHIEAGEAEIARWEASTQSNAQVQAYRQGTAPLQADVLLESVHKKKWASLEAEDLAANVEASALNDGLGTEGFNPEQYVLDKTRPYLDRLGGRDELMVPFASGVEKIRDGLRKRHEAKLAESRLLKDQSIVEDELDRAFDSALSSGAADKPDFFVQGMGSLYKAFGPRMNGGSLDLNYDQIDEQMLKVLERKAEQSPDAARAVFSYLDGTRPAVDGGTGRFALKSVAKYKPQIERIEAKARKTLADNYDSQLTTLVTGADAEAFDAADGSFYSLDEFKTFNDYSQKDFSLDAKKRKENAVAAWYQYAKENNVPEPVILDKFMRNGVEHPTMFAELKGVHDGIGSTNSGFDPNAPDQMDKVAKAGETYRAIVQKNPAYAAKYLSEKERAFYDTYAVGVTILKRSPQEAALMAVQAEQPDTKNLNLSRDNAEEIKTKVQSYGRSGWFDWFGGSPANQGELFDRTVSIANTLYRTGRMSSDEAVKAAHEYISENSVKIRGRTLMSPYIMKDDEPKIDVLLGAAFKQNKASMSLRGVTDASDLSIQPLNDDIFLITGGPDNRPLVGNDGKMLRMTLGQIQAARKKISDDEAKKSRQYIINQRGIGSFWQDTQQNPF